MGLEWKQGTDNQKWWCLGQMRADVKKCGRHTSFHAWSVTIRGTANDEAQATRNAESTIASLCHDPVRDAAPELLAALKARLKYEKSRDPMERVTEIEQLMLYTESQELTRAALKKAKGV